MNVEVLRDLIKKCDIYFEDQLISGELLLRVFTDFLSEEADRQENKGSIILHTASPCFDAIAVAWSALAVIAGNGADVESIIRYSAERNVESLSALKRMKTEKNGR